MKTEELVAGQWYWIAIGTHTVCGNILAIAEDGQIVTKISDGMLTLDAAWFVARMPEPPKKRGFWSRLLGSESTQRPIQVSVWKTSGENA